MRPIRIPQAPVGSRVVRGSRHPDGGVRVALAVAEPRGEGAVMPVEEAGMPVCRACPVSWTAGRAIVGERRQFTVFSAEVADMSILASLAESRYFAASKKPLHFAASI